MASGAKAALQGYRLQALYSLACILHPNSHGLVFQPEGNEDLAVYRGDSLIRVVQIKAYTDPLTLSCFSPDKPQSFFHRAANLTTRENLKVDVVSFGPIGTELEGAWSSQVRHETSVRKKLRDFKFTDGQIDRLFDGVQWSRAKEDDLKNEVYEFLRNSLAGGDPESAFDLLVAWLYVASENQRRITYTDLISKINAVGRYIAERTAHHQEWFTSIVPIEDTQINATQSEQLAKEFYCGVATRYSHILADIDVPRSNKLYEIDKAFSGGTRVVVVHGASGQGKTTIALRYLHDFVPEEWRFAIRYVQDRTHASLVANALADHLRVIDAPMYIYIDVSPRDHEWPELVRELLDQKNIRILVTIREEDLARKVSSDAELGFPLTIALDFDQNEARSIFERLSERGVAKIYPAFEDAWLRFGGEGPLLEFVFCITQVDSLKDRLHHQVMRLRDEVRAGTLAQEELGFLRACSVATAYEARIDIASLAKALQLQDPFRTLQLLEREYLLRPTEDKLHIEALHPIRSEILSCELTDPAFASWQDTALMVIPHIPESDLESFLLYSFARKPADVNTLIGALEQYHPKTWTGVAAIWRALMWLGMREYVIANQELIAEAQKCFGDGWFFFLKYDVAGVAPGADEKLLEALETFNLSSPELARAFRARQTDPPTAFNRLYVLGKTAEIDPAPPANASDWDGFAEVYFWAVHLSIENVLHNTIRGIDLSWPLVHLSLRSLGEVILSLSLGPKDVIQSKIEPFRNKIIDRFRNETKTFFVEENEKATRAHFIVPVELLQGNQKEPADNNSSGRILDNETRRLLELLRLFFPDSKAYGLQGYGHNTRLIPLPYDPTHKTAVDAEYLPPRWPVTSNAIFRNLGDWLRRPASWREYAETVIEIREQVVDTFSGLKKGLTGYFEGSKPGVLGKRVPQELWDKCVHATNQTLKLPKIALDEWGFAGEGAEPFQGETGQIRTGKQQISIASAPLAQAYRQYLKALNDYLSSLRNFFGEQTAAILIVNGQIGRLTSMQERHLLINRSKTLGFNPDAVRLSIYNLSEAWKALPALQSAFRKRLGCYIGNDRLLKLERREQELFPVTWALWFQFVNKPELKFNAADLRSLSYMDRILKDLQKNLRMELEGHQSPGWKYRIISEEVPWEESSALWLALDADEPLGMFEGLENLLQLLKAAIRPLDIGTLKQYVLDHNWTHILIVPFLSGRYFGDGIWCLPSYLFYGEDEIITAARTCYLAPKEPDSSVLTQLNIETIPLSSMDKMRLFQEAMGQLFLLVDHISDLRKIPDDLDEAGNTLFREYLQSKANEVSNAFGTMSNCIVDLLGNYPSEKELEHHPHLVAAGLLMTKLKDNIFPEAGMNMEVSLNLSEFDQWAERLKEGLSLIGIIRLFYAADAIQSK
ncbi:ATP-binding protein [Geomonas edaphica]|uniref:ATP-binding protein n=1 Tax=Geomonas edaphica TaxID=2570226 RepID=UPI0010A87693|nr:ATP-binding protein [Geomonas edaphica]